MNKKLIALALASAFAAPVAMADGVTIYGSLGMSMDLVDGGSTSTATQLSADTPVTFGTTQALGDARLFRSIDQTFANSSERRSRVSSNNSYIGLKGSEDISSDLSAIWQWEFAVAFDMQNSGDFSATDAQGTQSKRNTFAGLKSKTMGTVTLGLQDTPLKTSTGKLDMFNNTLGDYRTIFGAVGGSVRAQNSVLYTSPSMAGFTIKALHGFGDEAGSNVATNNGGEDPRIWSLSATYENGPIFATIAHEDNTGTGALQDTVGGSATSGNPVTQLVGLFGSGVNFMHFLGSDVILNNATPSSITYDSKLKTTRIGGGYNFGVFKLGLGWERSKSDVTVNDVNSTADYTEDAKRDAWYLSGAFTLGKTVLKAAYARANDFSGTAYTGVNDTGSNQWTLGVDYNLSKRTGLYALYTQVRNDTNGTYNLAGGATGIASVSVADVGQDPKAISIGMRHSF